MVDFSYITEKLFELKTQNIEKYSKKLIPTDKPIIGVAIPKLRKITKEISKENLQHFIVCYEEKYFEQLLLKAIVFSKFNAQDDEVLKLADNFITKINDWCVCDIFCQSFKYAKKYQKEVFEYLQFLAESNEEFKQRVVAVMLLSHYLNDEYIDRVFELLLKLNCGKYYTDMAVGWAVATAFAKQRDKTFEFLLSDKLTTLQYKVAVKKMCESYRVAQSDKDYFKRLIKNK